MQKSYIEYVKRMINVDLTPARDTYFDNRKGFNIDRRMLSPSDLNNVKRLAQTYRKEYEVWIAENGAYRLYIGVKRAKKASGK